MDGYGFPESAGAHRFETEKRIIEEHINCLRSDSVVLDIGAGVGQWACLFARKFASVTATEFSGGLFEKLQENVREYPNITAVHADALSFEPDKAYDLVFLGGLFCCLRDEDVLVLLKKLKRALNPGGIIISRDSTVTRGTPVTRGDSSRTYRKLEDYHRLYRDSALTSRHVRNDGQILLEMAEELLSPKGSFEPQPPSYFFLLPVVGRLVYWTVRFGYRWWGRILAALDIPFPRLTSHFFVACL